MNSISIVILFFFGCIGRFDLTPRQLFNYIAATDSWYFYFEADKH